MTVEMHIAGVHEAIFLRDRDAKVFMDDYREWLKEKDGHKIFEFYHGGSIHCFPLSMVVYLKVKMPTEMQTLDLAEGGPLLGTGGASARN